MFYHLSHQNFPPNECNRATFLLNIFPTEVLQRYNTGKHNSFKNSFKELLHTSLKTMWITVVIWYFCYDKIILNIIPHQVVNKDIIITIIYVFVYITTIIIFLKSPKVFSSSSNLLLLSLELSTYSL